MTFDESFTLLVGNEGCFTKNSRDAGNWTGGEVGKGTLLGTKYGISAASYPALPIETLSLAQAKAIYKEDFWGKCKIDYLPESIRFDVFDTAVNSGVSRASKLLQKTAGVKEDGILGIVTLTAISKLAFDPQRLDKRFNAQRILFITALSQANWGNFGKGWMIRIANNMLKD
jgi:lysozyme family protein